MKMPDHKEAAMQMTTQVISNVLNELSQDSNFK